MTELILIRHGETAWNCESRWQGHQDSPLSPAGMQQAEALARRLAGLAISALYASDLGRAVQTASTIAARTGHSVVLEAGLRERGLGVFEGLTLADIKERHPAEYERFASRDPEHTIPGGESLRGKHERAVQTLERIAGAHPGRRVVAVTHGGILDSAFRHAAGLPLTHSRRWILYNGGLNTFLIDDGRWSLGTWGDVAHLRQAGTLDDY